MGASWLDHPSLPATTRADTTAKDALCLFRRLFEVTDVESWARARVSADSSYRLWINGRLAARGPARGTHVVRHFDELDLRELVREGADNVLAAEVLRWGRSGPTFDLSTRLGFFFDAPELASDASFRAFVDPGYNPDGAPDFPRIVHVAGNWMEHRDTRARAAGWRAAGFDDGAWSPARELRAEDAPWTLAPRAVPLLRVGEPFDAPAVEVGVVEPGRASSTPPFGFSTAPRPGADGALALPVRFEPGDDVVYVAFDLGRIANGHPTIELDAPPGVSVELMYAEAPSLNGWKTDRTRLAGQRIEGYRDELVTRGGTQSFEPHARRTFRLLRVAIGPRAEAVTLRAARLAEVNYPFLRTGEEGGDFACSDPTLERIWHVGWDTCRLCTSDTFEDSPYYERLQYVGDARIGALIGYVVAGEHALAERALLQLAESRTSSGFLQARYPAREPQVIPGFSLLWIEMCEEHHLYTGREDTVRGLLPLVRELLDTFAEHEDVDGCLRELPMWNFLDWSFPDKGVLQREGDVNAPLSMSYVGALRAAARLHERLGESAHAAALLARAQRSANAALRQTWSEREGLFFDGVVRRSLSVHTNALALLHGFVEGEQAQALAERLFSDPRLVRSTFYFDFYVHRALERLGRADLLLADLSRWRSMLDVGATAWFETNDESRSDCHAWSASPTFDLLTTVLGVRIAAPGFRRVTIDPHPGALDWARGRVATPHGPIRVAWERRDDGELDLEVELPPGVERVDA